MNMLFLTGYYARKPDRIRGGVGYRYVGLYGSLVQLLLKRSPESRIFWYSHTDRYLRIVTRTGEQITESCYLRAMLDSLSATMRSRSRLVIMLTYPYGVPRFRDTPEYLLSLLIARVFWSRRVELIVDVIDPPVENAQAFSVGELPLLSLLYARVLQKVTLKLASHVITLTDSYKRQVSRVCGFDRERVMVVPCGSLVRQVHYAQPKPSGSLVVLYAGSAMQVKDIDKLISAITRLRQEGLSMELHIAGARLMELPDWVHCEQTDWASFASRVLPMADVGVIPYPPSKLHFSFTSVAKLFDYMAGGKPVITTNLKETSKIVKTFDCGLVARDWREFEAHLRTLYWNRDLAKTLGKNGRRAAEEEFDYELLAQSLLLRLVSTLG